MYGFNSSPGASACRCSFPVLVCARWGLSDPSWREKEAEEEGPLGREGRLMAMVSVGNVPKNSSPARSTMTAEVSLGVGQAAWPGCLHVLASGHCMRQDGESGCTGLQVIH